MRTLAVDLGTRRIGLALSDQDGRLATPHEVLHVSHPDQAIAPILQLIAREAVQRLVVGLPLNMDDSLGPAARAAVAWGRDLAARAGIPVLFVDERLSSFEADQQLAQRRRGGEKLTRRRQRSRQDALAAALVLQAFLDGRLAAIPPVSLPSSPSPLGRGLG